MKESGTLITWLTCYDYSFARVLASTELDMILVGDSGGMVALGYKDTVPVTMDEMIQLTASVRRGAPEKFIVGDMPKGSYEESNEVAIRNAMRFVKETGCDAIKLEGGGIMIERIHAIVQSGISVIGHLGLTPQSASSCGGYRVIGRNVSEQERLIKESLEMQQAGAMAILLEALTPSLAEKLQSKLSILVFGIGAGINVDGQLLILHDMLGLYPDFRPKFAKCYVPEAIQQYQELQAKVVRESLTKVNPGVDGLFEIAKIAVNLYIREVRDLQFPTAEFSYKE
jgi:3-methyl-2-oxobutanoate hydroxymethyltransferase